MTSNTPYDQVYKTLDEVVDNIEILVKEVSSNLFQKIVDVLKAKETPPTDQSAPAVNHDAEVEVKKDEQSN